MEGFLEEGRRAEEAAAPLTPSQPTHDAQGEAVVHLSPRVGARPGRNPELHTGHDSHVGCTQQIPGWTPGGLAPESGLVNTSSSAVIQLLRPIRTTRLPSQARPPARAPALVRSRLPHLDLTHWFGLPRCRPPQPSDCTWDHLTFPQKESGAQSSRELPEATQLRGTQAQGSQEPAFSYFTGQFP